MMVRRGNVVIWDRMDQAHARHERYVVACWGGDMVQTMTMEDIAEALHDARHYDEPGYAPTAVWYWSQDTDQPECKIGRLESVAEGELMHVRLLSVTGELLDEAYFRV